jgi:thymidylate kinase
MRIVPVRLWTPSVDDKDRLAAYSEQSALSEVIEGRGFRLRRRQKQASHFLDRIALESRVLIIEGIAGSGKDTLQTYLKKKLKGRDVHDFSEGELLHSWKHFPIEGILKLKVKFMEIFVNHLKDIVSRDENTVFILNRFHLSTYVSIITRQPELEREYDLIIKGLRTVPVHVFILQLDENEIEKRSLHSERSGVWQKLQQQMATKDGFRNRLEKYISQQRLIIETAKRQQIPYSVIKVFYEPKIGGGWVHVPEARSDVRHGVRMNAADSKISRRKRDLPRTS